MVCPKCGFNLADEADYCADCGAFLGAAKLEAKRKLTLGALKGFFSSPLYLTLILLAALELVAKICRMVFGASDLSSGLNSLQDIFPDFVYSGIAENIYRLIFIANLLQILLAVALIAIRYLIYHSAFNQNKETLNYKAIDALRWVYWLGLSFLIVLVVSIVIYIFATIGGLATTQFEFKILIAVILVVCAIVFALPVLYTVFLTKSLKRVRDTAATGIADSKTSMFVVIYLFISAGLLVSELLSVLSAGDWFGLAVNSISSAWMIVFALVLLKYRNLMQMLNKR